jgi:hypothetical protein
MEFWQSILHHVDARLSAIVVALWVGVIAALVLSLVGIQICKRLARRVDGVLQIVGKLHRYEQARLLREREQARQLKGFCRTTWRSSIHRGARESNEDGAPSWLQLT